MRIDGIERSISTSHLKFNSPYERRDDSPLCVLFVSFNKIGLCDCSSLMIRMNDMLEQANRGSEIKVLLEEYPSLKQALQNIRQVVWVMDPETEAILYVSPAFEAVWGRSCESLYADPILLIKSVHPEDRVKVMAASPDDHRKSMDQSYRIEQPDGSLRWISAHTFQVNEKSSNTVYQVCVAQDITDQNQIDQTLRKALDHSREQFTLSRRMSLARKPEAVLKTLMSVSELRAAKRAYVLFFDPTLGDPHRDMEVITSWSTVPYSANPSAKELLNEASLFEELAVSDLFHPAKPVVITEIANDERLTNTARCLLQEREIQTVAFFPMVALGDWLGCLLIFFPQEKHFDPVALRHIKVLVDQATITLYNLQLLEIEAESRYEAERANEIKTRFLAMISHELRTPLTSIKGFTTTLLADDVTWEPAEQRDFVLTIQQEANRLQELIDHLLDLSRLEAGMLPIVLEAHTLQEIIVDVLPQFQVMTQKHTLSFRVPADLPPVLVDAKRIAQVLANLVHNAAMYAPDGTEIILVAGVRGGWIRVSVIDQGPGIPPVERKHVFQPFRRGIHEENEIGNSIRTGKGAGLGLAICKGLVEAHGGRIWIKKQAAPGTTISFTIPLATTKVPFISTGKA
jgi:PAS domain S-box-containing protein